MESCKTCECHDFLGGKGIYRGHKYMSYKEYIKTPNWCPKGWKTYLVEEKVECPVLEVKSYKIFP